MAKKKRASKESIKNRVTTKPKKARKKTTSRKKTAADVRKKLVWGVFSSSMKEEGRFPYDQRSEAEKKVEQLQAKSKKPYFIQPIKEVLGETTAAKPAKKTTKKAAASEEE